MTPECAGCGGPVIDRLSVQYRYPRDAYLPEAVDPWWVHGGMPLLSCGSLACGAAALLAAIDKHITEIALAMRRLLEPEDFEVLQIGHPADLTYDFMDPGEAA